MAREKNRISAKVAEIEVEKDVAPESTLNGGPSQAGLHSGKMGVQHLVECTCILPQYLKSDNPVFHKFIVFSVILEDDSVQQKYTQCNFCGVVHNVIGICESEVVYGSEDTHSVITKEDIAISLPQRLAGLLEDYKCELPIWEHVKFIIDEQQWNQHVIITRELIDGRQTGKFLSISGPERFGISPYSEAVQYETSD